MKTVEVDGLRHHYTKATGRKQAREYAVDDISFEVGEGEFFVLLGPSGCGKTTTLRCVAGLERPASGTIKLAGQVVVSGRRFVPPSKRNLGMVFQDYAIWPHMSVFDNVAFPLTVGQKKRRADVRGRVQDTLAMVGLDHLAERPGTQLSGGQQQRVSLARAIVCQPAVLLLDEPLSNLDAALRERMRAELRSIQQRTGITTMLVTHDQTEALSMATRIALMDEGRIVQLATPRELYERPVSRFVAEFIGSGSFFDGTVLEERHKGDAACYLVDTPLGKVAASSRHTWSVGDDVTLAVRPEDVTVHPASPIAGENEFHGVVRRMFYVGDAVDLHIDVGGTLIRAKARARDVDLFGADETVAFHVPAEYAVIIAS